MNSVVIVGGGYTGTTLARALDAAFEVVLVEPRGSFVHNVAAIRALVEPGLVDRIILPYGRLLRRGEVVQGRVVAVAEGGVVLDSGQTISGDYVVLATGSTYAQPFKPATDSMEDFRAASAAGNAAIKEARSIAIVGAGAVGVELAGEIASSLKGKEVTLVSSTPSLFPDFAPGVGERLAASLKAMGVNVKVGVKALGLSTNAAPQHGPLHLENGEVIASELVMPAVGARPEARVLADLPTARFDRLGRVDVDDWMRPAGLKRVFALGDMAALKALVDPSHILFGSDFPFAPAPLVGVEVNNLEELTIFDPKTMAGVNRSHALKLFPQFAAQNEAAEAHRIPPQPRAGALKVAAARRAVGLVDWLRNR